MTTEYKLFINGQWTTPGSSFDVLNPADQMVYAKVADAGVEDAKSAVAAAAAASEAWGAMSHDERAKGLLKGADILEERQQDIAGQLVAEAGSWIGKAMYETGIAPQEFRSAVEIAGEHQATVEEIPSHAGKVSMVERRPLGVVTVISPWNFPLLLSSRGVAMALAVGNSVVLKPSEETPISGGIVLAQAFEEAGGPAGVFNVITCSRDNVVAVGDELITSPHVKAIDFTGSTAVGSQIGAKAGALFKKVCLELGGKDALIILDDADMKTAVNATTFGCFMHQGQVCMSAERLIVHESLAEEFTKRLVDNVNTLGSGDPTEMGKVIGPIINQKQLDNIHCQVEDARAKDANVLTGGSYEGLYYQPTVISGVTRDMSIFRDETFGPVAPVITVASDDEAVDVANDSVYGLSARRNHWRRGTRAGNCALTRDRHGPRQ